MTSTSIRWKLLLSTESDIDTFEKVIELVMKEELAITYSKQFSSASTAAVAKKCLDSA